MNQNLKILFVGWVISVTIGQAYAEPPASSQTDKSGLLAKVQQDLKAQRYDAAIQGMEQLYALEASPVLLLNIAVAREKQRAPCSVRAAAYQRLLEVCQGCSEEVQARKRLAFIQADCFGALRIDTNPSNLEVLLNGRSIGRAPIKQELAEGTYEVSARTGVRHHTLEVDVTRKAVKNVVLELPPIETKAEAATTPKVADDGDYALLQWSITGSGVVLLGVGGYLMADAKAVHDEVGETGHNVTYQRYKTDALERHKTGLTLLSIGSVIALSGLTWWALSAPEPDAKRSAGPFTPQPLSVGFGPGMLYLGGSL